MTARGRQGLASLAIQVGFLLALLAWWQAAVSIFKVSAILLPAPADVFGQLVDVLKSGEFWPDLQITLTELAIAFAVAAVLGLAIGAWVGATTLGAKVFEPLFAGLYAIPTILFFPLFVLFFGVGPGSKIAMGIAIAFFPIALSTLSAIAGTPPLYRISARAMGASPVQLFFHVLAPAAWPRVLSGLRMGFILAFLAILGAETITAFAGLGHQIVSLGESLDTAKMFAYILFVIAIAAVLNGVVSLLQKKLS